MQNTATFYYFAGKYRTDSLPCQTSEWFFQNANSASIIGRNNSGISHCLMGYPESPSKTAFGIGCQRSSSNFLFKCFWILCVMKLVNLCIFSTKELFTFLGYNVIQ
uniref:Uncharacterized protein n=1 Tax=Romanomermis culicivorax TaxID=13658 RepID=A0A915KLE5_ROMCU